MTRRCLECGSPFKAGRNAEKYCTHACYICALQRKKPKATCRWCKKEFSHSPSVPRKFCSKVCLQQEREARATKRCSNCGKEFRVWASKKQACCSYECAWKLRTDVRRPKDLQPGQIGLQDGSVAVVDLCDVDLVAPYIWGVDRCGYVRAKIGGHQVRLHQLVFGPIPEGMEIDHRNRNKLDNRRENLRLATRSQQRANTRRTVRSTSGYKGVTFYKGKWRAACAGKWLGDHAAVEDAAHAYDAAALEKWGEFAVVNFKPSSL